MQEPSLLELAQKAAKRAADIQYPRVLFDVLFEEIRRASIDAFHHVREDERRTVVAREHGVVCVKWHGLLHVARIEESTNRARADIIGTKWHD